MKINFKGNTIHIAGPRFQVGDKAPDFQATSPKQPFGPVTDVLKQYPGKKILTSFPSIDTGTCALQIKRFNQEAEERKIPVIVLASDQPFALARACESFQTTTVATYSDSFLHDFGKTYGLEILENGLLARSVYVLDENNIIIHAEISSNLTDEVDYDAALAKL